MAIIPKSRKFRYSFRNKLTLYAKNNVPLHTRKNRTRTAFFNCNAYKITTTLKKNYNTTNLYKFFNLVNTDEFNTKLGHNTTQLIPNSKHQLTQTLKFQIPKQQHLTYDFENVKATSCKHYYKLHIKSHSVVPEQIQLIDYSNVKQQHFQQFCPLLFGTSGIAFQSATKLSAKLISTVMLVIARTLKKHGRVWLRLCCDTPVSARPLETRMGKGKGSISHWEAKAFPGTVFVEFHGLSETRLNSLFSKIKKKLGVCLNLIKKY